MKDMNEHFFLHPSSRTRKGLDPLLFGLIIVKVSFCSRQVQDTISERQVSCLSMWPTAKYPLEGLGTAPYPTSGFPYWSKTPLCSHSGQDGSQSTMSKHSWTGWLWDKAMLSFRSALVTSGCSVVPWTRLMAAWRKICWNLCSVGSGPLHHPFFSTDLPFLSCSCC